MKDKTMTNVIEDFIDSLKIPEIDKNGTDLFNPAVTELGTGIAHSKV